MSPLQAPMNAGPGKHEPECVTCNRTMLNREECQYHKIDMSTDGTFMTMICQGMYNTLWKFHDFSVTQILREINSEDSILEI